MSLIENIKEHPYETGGIAFVGVIALYLILSSGGGGKSSGSSLGNGGGSDVAAATAAYAAQQEANTKNNSTNASLAAYQTGAAASIELAKIQAATTRDANNLTASVDLAHINKGYDTQVNLAQIQSSTAESLAYTQASTTNYNNWLNQQTRSQEDQYNYSNYQTLLQYYYNLASNK